MTRPAEDDRTLIQKKKWVGAILTIIMSVLCTEYNQWLLRREVDTVLEENQILRAHFPKELLPPKPEIPGLWEVAAFALEKDENSSGWCAYLFMIGMAWYTREFWFWWHAEVSLYQTTLVTTLGEGQSFADFCRYRADYWLSTQPAIKPLALGTFTLFVVLLGGIISFFVHGQSLGMALWGSWIFVVDTAAHHDEEATGARCAALGVTVVGMLIFALMIGLISDSLAGQLNSLKHGKATVMESGHIVIIGWSAKLYSLLVELALAEESAGGCVMVVLAEMEKDEMEEILGTWQLDMKGSTVICRKGSPLNTRCLAHVSTDTAKCVVVFSPSEASADEADAYICRVLMCLKHAGEPMGHVVVELQDIDNEAMIHRLAGPIVETIVAHDFIGRLVVQTSNQPNIAAVFESLFGFGGDEFYTKEWHSLEAFRFDQVLFSFADAIPLGVITANGVCKLNPPRDYIMAPGDQVIVIAEDDDTYQPAAHPFWSMDVTQHYVKPAVYRAKEARKILVVGWRRDIVDILAELSAVSPHGTQVTIFAEIPVAAREESLAAASERCKARRYSNINVKHVSGNPMNRRDLECLEDLAEYTHAFVLREEGMETQPAKSDNRTLTCLFMLRAAWAKVSGGPSTLEIITESMDSATKTSIGTAGHVVSLELVSAAMAQVAQCRQVNLILQQLLTTHNNSVQVASVGDYMLSAEVTTFWEILAAVRHDGQILMGYLEADGTVILNPKDKFTKRLWKLSDRLVILKDSEAGITSGRRTPRAARSKSIVEMRQLGNNVIRGMGQTSIVVPSVKLQTEELHIGL